jgi:hypothetical protein
MDSNCNTYRGCVRVERQRERLAGQKARRGAKELADFPGDEKLTRATTIRSLRTAWPGGQPFGFSENFPLFPWIARPVRRTIASARLFGASGLAAPLPLETAGNGTMAGEKRG